ncbi:MAG TPA: hypothetical protein ENK06_10055 [Gammaproteobacteria bacterium]|nr:hypothetical protein [Gammaproteobacteria bacterium]
MIEVDFHYADNQLNEEVRLPYWEEMEKVKVKTLNAIKDAYKNSSTQYVLFTHGRSTSRIGKTTSSSVVSSSVVRELINVFSSTPA